MPKVSDAHKEHRREQILAAAGRCFARQGYADTTMPDIFAEAGLSAGAVYTYFASKQELYRALMAEAVQADLRRYEAAALDGGEPWPKLKRLVELYMAGLDDEAHAPFFRLYLTEFLPAGLTDPAAAAPLKARMDRLHGLFCRVLEEGMAAGAFRPLDAGAVAALVLAAGDGIRLHALAYDRRADGRVLCEAFAANLEKAIRNEEG